MAHVLLFHSVLGLRPGIKQFADQLRKAGHTVTTPDLYDGKTFDDYEVGNKKWSSIGIPAILKQSKAIASELGEGLVFAGFSNGAAIAEFLAATQPKAKGAFLFHGALPLKDLELSRWPKQVPVQLHYNDKDPFRDPANDSALKKAVTNSGAHFEEFLYKGKTHLFTDSDLPDYNEKSSSLLIQRTLEALDKIV